MELFQDLSINDRFVFPGECKIYTKTTLTKYAPAIRISPADWKVLDMSFLQTEVERRGK